MLITYNRLIKLVESGVINANPANVNGSSIDITLGDILLVESGNHGPVLVDPSKPNQLITDEIDLSKGPHVLGAGECVLASSVEIFNLPSHISAEYKLKSSMARVFLNNMLAGWCDPTWHNSTLTLELKNECKYHSIRLSAGMKIGQIVFWSGVAVPNEKSYAARGQYNNQGVRQGQSVPNTSGGLK